MLLEVVPVVQAYCYSKYLGRLRLNFDRETGRLLSPADGRGVSEAEVLLLDSSVKKDPGVEKAMDRYRARMSEYYQVVGSTAVFLEKVEQRESNLGDVVADSMMEAWPPGEMTNKLAMIIASGSCIPLALRRGRHGLHKRRRLARISGAGFHHRRGHI